MRNQPRTDCNDVRAGDELLAVDEVVLLFDNARDERQGLLFVDGIPLGGFTVHPLAYLDEQERLRQLRSITAYH